MTEAIGWMSALVLMATLAAQVVRQWKDRTNRGISVWLFAGQLAASAGFILYSILVHNVVFVITNTLIALVAMAGELSYYRNRRLASKNFQSRNASK